MNLNDLFTEEKVRLDPKCWTGKKIGNPKTKMKGGVRVNNCVPAESINEFAPPGGDDREPNEEEILRQLAAQWWLGTEQQMAKAQRTLEVMGWEIGQDESGDDDAGVFLIRAGDANGNSYMAFNHSDLEDLAEGLTEMDKSQTPPGRDGSNDLDAGKKEYTAKATTAKKVAKDAEKILNKELNKKQGVAETMATFSAKASTRNSGSGEFRGVSIPSDMKHPEWREPTWSFQEIAQKLGIPVATLNLLAFNRIGGFPEALSGLSARHGSKKYYKQSEVKRWVNANNVREKLKQGVAENQLDEKSVSQAQFRTMAAAAHNPKFAKKVGISQAVAKEFYSADKHSNYKKLPDRTTEGELDEGWKSALGAAAIAGTMAMGAGGAHARVSGDYADNPEINRLTGQPKVTQQISPDAAKPAAAKPGFSKEYLQSVVDGTHPRPLISKERAQELLQQQTTNEQGEQQKGADYRDPPEANYGDDYQDMVARVKKLAGLGPLKTVYDPAKRVYRNMPTAVQPKKWEPKSLLQKRNATGVWKNLPSWVHNAPKTVPDTVLDTIGALQKAVRAQPPGQTHSTKALN